MSQELKELLNKEIYRRSNSGLWSHLLVLSVTYFVLNEFYQTTIYSPTPVIGILVAIVLRYLCSFSFKNNETIRRGIFLASTLVLGLSWGQMTLQIVRFYGVESVQTMIAMGLLSTMVAIAVSSLSAYPPALIVFLVSCTTVPTYILFSQASVAWRYVGLFFVLNLVYQIFAGHRIYRSIVKQIKELLKEKQEKQRLQELIDSIPVLVIMIGYDQTYRMVNNFQDGYFQRLFLGRELGVFNYSPLENAIKNFLDSDLNYQSLEIQSFDFGLEEWFLLTMNRLSYEQGIICSVNPITEFVKTRNELQIQKARNDYSSKLMTLGEVAANITHELGNPLAIIKGSVQVLESELADTPLSAIAKKKLADIDSTANRMGSIISGLKSISQSQGLNLKNVRFLDLMEPVKEITAQKMKEKNISLIINGEESQVDLFCDDVQMSQVLLNLVDNAVDAISNNDLKWICVTYRPGFEWCEITVQDSGLAPGKEVKEKMMVPFFTTKREQKGTGLGLSLSEKIVREHNGVLSISDSEERTTFVIRLPRMT